MIVYNENDPFAAQWLRNLSAAEHIAPGQVLDASIKDLQPSDVENATQFHAFAGIGGWSHALRLAGWPDDHPVWTGSCPCQPFSVAGKGKGIDDERHLWPEWYRLIKKCRPATIFGEQVASPAGRTWLDNVSLDLEALGYIVGTADLCAAGVGAPHIRQRLWFVAYADCVASRQGSADARGGDQRSDAKTWPGPGGRGGASELAYSDGGQLKGRSETNGGNFTNGADSRRAKSDSSFAGDSRAGKLGYTDSGRLSGDARASDPAEDQRGHGTDSNNVNTSGAVRGFWADAEWIPCRDGKARAIKPGLEPLASRISNRMGRLRGYGNAIVPQLAAEFIKAAMAVR